MSADRISGTPPKRAGRIWDRLLHRAPGPGPVSVNGDPAKNRARTADLLFSVLSSVTKLIGRPVRYPVDLLAWQAVEKFGDAMPGKPRAEIERLLGERQRQSPPPPPKDLSLLNISSLKMITEIPLKDKKRILALVGFLPREGLMALFDTGATTALAEKYADHEKFQQQLFDAVIVYFHYQGALNELIASVKYTGNKMLLMVQIAKALLKIGRIEHAAGLLTEYFNRAPYGAAIYYDPDQARYRNLFLETLQTLEAVAPGLYREEGLSSLLDRYQAAGCREKDDARVVSAGFVYSRAVVERTAASSDGLTASLLRLGATLKQLHTCDDRVPVPVFLGFWESVRGQSESVRKRVIAQVSERPECRTDKLEAVIMGLVARGDFDPYHEAKCKLKDKLQEQRISNPQLEARAENDPSFAPLIGPVLEIAQGFTGILDIAHLFTDENEINYFKELLKKNDMELRRLFSTENDVKKKIQLWVVARSRDLFGSYQDDFMPWVRQAQLAMEEPDFVAAAQLLEAALVPPKIRDEIKSFCLRYIKERFRDLIGIDGNPEDVPQKIREAGRESAELASKALGLVRGVARQTKKPLLNIYILSTAHGFNGERFLEGFLKNPDKRRTMLERIRNSGVDHQKRIDKLAAIPDADKRIEEEMRIIHRFFYEIVDRFQGHMPFDRLTLVMMVGALWVQKGFIDYFTYPVEIKIPSGKEPTPDVVKQLEGLAKKAVRHGWDIALIDHSTVRTSDIHANDAPDSKNGRAIARGIQILSGAVRAAGDGANPAWLYKTNNWNFSGQFKNGLPTDRVNLVGINLYDGKVYDGHFRGRKDGWVKIDDHCKTIVGVEAAQDGGKITRSIVALEKAGDDRYRAISIPGLYWTEFRQELARLEGWPANAPSFRYSNLLFVCNANHHRSPTFEILFTTLLREQYGADAEKMMVASAGLEVDSYLQQHPEKNSMSARARQMLLDRGIQVNGKEKNQLTEEMVGSSDLVLVMTQREKEALQAKFPAAGNKVRTIKEYLGFPAAERDIPTPKDFTEETLKEFERLSIKLIQKIVA